MMSQLSNFKRITLFFGIAYGFTWIFWGGMAIFAVSYKTLVGTILHAIGGLGPTVAAIFCLILFDSKKEKQIYRKQIFKPTSKDSWWLFIAFFLNIVISVVLAILGIILWGENTAIQNMIEIITQPFNLVFIIIFNLIASFMEEPGWRGWALPELQKKWNPFVSSVILSLLWAVWHTPLYFIPDSYQNAEIGFGTSLYWVFNGFIIAPTFIMTWIYNHTDSGILSAILFHFSMNFAGELFDLSLKLEILRLIVYILIMVGIIWKENMFSKNK